MGFQAKISPENMQEVRRMLQRLPEELRSGVMIKVFQKNASVIESQMQSDVPVSKHGAVSKKYPTRSHPAGYLKRSIGIVTGRGTNYPTLWIRPRREIGGFDAWYEHLPQMRHKTGDSGKETNKITPFVRTAFTKTRSRVESSIQSDLEAEINKMINR